MITLYIKNLFLEKVQLIPKILFTKYERGLYIVGT